LKEKIRIFFANFVVDASTVPYGSATLRMFIITHPSPRLHYTMPPKLDVVEAVEAMLPHLLTYDQQLLQNDASRKENST
jgi:hypothetical protein